MASRTQLRLSQVTGSFAVQGDGKSIITTEPASTVASLALNDLSGSLSVIASAIGRIHGRSAGEAFNNDEGTFYTNVLPNNNNSLDLGSAANNFANARVQAVQSAAALDIDATSGALSLDGSAGINIGTNADVAVDFNSAALDIDASGAVTIDTTSTFSIDGVGSSNVTTDTGNLLLQTTTSGQVDISAAGSVDIDAGSDITLDAGSTGEIILTADGGKVILTGSSGADSVHVRSEMTVVGNAQFDADVIVTGDLTINGATTTVSTTNLLVEDALIGLQSELTAGNTNDIGFIFERGTTGDNAAFIWDESVDKFKLGTTTATPDSTGDLTVAAGDLIVNDLEAAGITTTDVTATHVVYGGSSNELKGEADFSYTEGSNTLRVDNIQVNSNAGNKISINSNRLKIESVDSVFLDAADAIALDGVNGVELYGNGSQYGLISGSIGGSQSDALVISSSAGNSLTLDSNSGYVFLTSGNSASTKGVFDLNTSGELRIASKNDVAFQLSLADDADHTLSGSLTLDNGAAKAQIVFEEESGNGSNTVTLQSPQAAIGSSYQITLPNGIGTAGQVLKINSVTGQRADLSFGDALGDLSKGVKIIASAVAAGTAVNFNSVDAGETISGLSTASSQGKSLDVFVNGQLLVSGSESERAAGNRDYAISSGTELKFAFSLEADDVVQLIKR